MARTRRNGKRAELTRHAPRVVQRGIVEGGDTIDIELLRAFGARFAKAWDAREPEAVAALCHPQTVWEDPAIPEPVEGPEAVAEHVRTTLAAFSDLAFVPGGDPAITITGTVAHWPWRMVGTNDGPIDPPGFPATGRFIDVPGINIWSFRDGKLWRNNAVYDRANMARQLGLMPAPRSRAEQLYVTMAQLRARMPD